MIRQAGIGDLDKILELNKKLFEFEIQFGDTFNQDWTYSDKGKNYFKNRLTEDSGVVFVAKEGNEIVGYLCSCIDTYPYRSVNPIAEVENMFVLEEYRGRGIGSELIREFREECHKRGVKHLRVGHIIENQQAGKFYSKHGFSAFETYLEKLL